MSYWAGSSYLKYIGPVPSGDKHYTTGTKIIAAAATIAVTYSISVATRVELRQIHQPDGILLEPRITVNNFGALGFGEGIASFAVGAFTRSNIIALRVLILDATHQLAFASAIAVTSFVVYRAPFARQLPHLPSMAAHLSGWD